MPDYTKFLPYFIELDRICEEKNFDKITIMTLRKWFLSILYFYKPNNDILNHFDIEEYIKYNFEKLKQVKTIKLFKLEEILNNSNCLLYRCIKKIPFNQEESEERLSKVEGRYILNENGDYYLPVNGVCHNGKSIELVDKPGSEDTLQHELQHINQNYIYPSEFPFANEMQKMLKEDEANYHRHFIDLLPCFKPIEIKDQYYIYYLVYTLLMLALPKKMHDSWSKIDTLCPSSYIFSDIFKYISSSKADRKDFSQLFSLATLIVASCNSENTEEIIDVSVNTSLKRCSNEVDRWHQIIESVLETNRKNNLKNLQYYTQMLNERINILKNPSLLQEKYLEAVQDEKEFIAGESDEEQKELLHKLQLFTLEKFKSILIEEVEECKRYIENNQNKKEQSSSEILGDEDYKRYQYYQFGVELNQSMQLLLSQKLTFTDFFEQFLEKIASYLIENKDPRLDEKLSFIDEVRNKCLIDFKKL